jgi:hypothetical protein
MSETTIRDENPEFKGQGRNGTPQPTLPEKLYAEVRSTRVATQVIAWVVCVIVAINLIVGWVMAAQLVHLVDLVNQPTY